MKIMVTGANGYIGRPVCYELRKTHKVIEVDNLARDEWVGNATGRSPLSFFTGLCRDLKGRDTVNELLSIHKPDIIIHLASQPSMPYAQINGERALFTQINNIAMYLNLLWGIKENGLKTKIILTTTTGISGQFYETVREDRTFNVAGSWYHVSRGFDSANSDLAARQWGQEIIEFRTSIVYGVYPELYTKIDTDFYFGTVVNRFVRQALDGKPITIYGEGEQTKPFIALEDCVFSILNAIDYKVDGHKIFNQVTQSVSINRLAKAIQFSLPSAKIEYIKNPRKEKEDFKMHFNNEGFLKLLLKRPIMIEDGIEDMVKELMKEKDFNKTITK